MLRDAKSWNWQRQGQGQVTKRNEIFQVQSAIMTCPFELHLPGVDHLSAIAESITSQVLQQRGVRARFDIAEPVPQVLLKLILSNAWHAIPALAAGMCC